MFEVNSMKKVVKQHELVCGDCRHFVRHYRKWGKGFYPVGCGHCHVPKIKQRVSDQKSCPHWEAKGE